MWSWFQPKDKDTLLCETAQKSILNSQTDAGIKMASWMPLFIVLFTFSLWQEDWLVCRKYLGDIWCTHKHTKQVTVQTFWLAFSILKWWVAYSNSMSFKPWSPSAHPCWMWEGKLVDQRHIWKKASHAADWTGSRLLRVNFRILLRHKSFENIIKSQKPREGISVC